MLDALIVYHDCKVHILMEWLIYTAFYQWKVMKPANKNVSY